MIQTHTNVWIKQCIKYGINCICIYLPCTLHPLLLEKHPDALLLCPRCGEDTQATVSQMVWANVSQTNAKKHRSKLLQLKRLLHSLHLLLTWLRLLRTLSTLCSYLSCVMGTRAYGRALNLILTIHNGTANSKERRRSWMLSQPSSMGECIRQVLEVPFWPVTREFMVLSYSHISLWY